MATKKRKLKVRDPEKTRLRLIRVVGEIMREKGYQSLNISQVARRAGVDRRLVSYHFQNLGNLEKAYIREKDYWLPFFDRFKLSDDPTMTEMRDLFTTMMQENFRFFFNDAEMQKIILWQISESNPLMRSISDAREVEGAKLIAKAEKLFRGTGVSLKAILALLLGGSYYMVLHASSNKSVVCGIDINEEKDRLDVTETIKKIISWAFEKTDVFKKKQEQEADMNYELELLENLSKHLSSRNREAGENNIPDQILSSEVSRLEKVFMQQLMGMSSREQVATALRIILHRLTAVCDRLYLAEREGSANAGLILQLIESIRVPLINDAPRDISIPLTVGRQKLEGFKVVWSELRGILLNSGMEGILLEIMSHPLFRFEASLDKMDYADLDYLENYFNGLKDALAGGGISFEELMDLLVALNFNFVRFTVYWNMKLMERLKDKDELEANQMVNRIKTCLKRAATNMEPYDQSRAPIADELIKWIEEEVMLHITVAADQSPNPLKFASKLKVLELAYWQKLLYDHGVYDEPNLDTLAEKTAYNFSSRGQLVLSASSIKSKLYPKDRSVIDPIRKILKDMLDDLEGFMG